METPQGYPNANIDGDIQKSLKLLKASYTMWEDTKRDTATKMKDAVDNEGNKKYTQADIDEQIQRLSNAEQDVINQYLALGGTMEELTSKSKGRRSRKSSSGVDKTLEPIVAPAIDALSKPSREFVAPTQKPGSDENAQYDVIPLPSGGECYKSKQGQVPVAYLTAYDENMIASPNLYRDNLILDYMLNEKVLIDHSVLDPADMIEGDRDAIILFLRASGYGNEYQITAKDQDTGKEFDTTIDLSRIKFKEFNLKGDENGWFDFVLPVSKKQVKFRFLTHRDEKRLREIEEVENIKIQRTKLADIAKTLDTMLDAEGKMEAGLKVKLREAVRNIEKWDESLSDEDFLPYTHMLTNRLELSIMSIDGDTDRRNISNFVRKMAARDSFALRKYILENEPGVDYNITVQKPESLGGGSQTVFLQLDEYIFLNVS